MLTLSLDSMGELHRLALASLDNTPAAFTGSPADLLTGTPAAPVRRFKPFKRLTRRGVTS